MEKEAGFLPPWQGRRTFPMEVIVRIRMAQVNVFLGGSAIQATTRMRRVLSRPGCIALHCIALIIFLAALPRHEFRRVPERHWRSVGSSEGMRLPGARDAGA